VTNWTRIVMNAETQRIVEQLDVTAIDALEISGSSWRSQKFKSYTSTDFPEFDICNLASPSPAYDLVIAEQVFEHILWPYRAGRNVHAILRPGGYFLVTTPFLLPIHEVPVDCSRWTPLGMKHFLAECGFAIDDIQVDSWGNKPCVKANLNGWVTYVRWRHSLRNDPKFPVVVWALARKARS
jgi:SAM-dependent methyltransferase